MQGERLYKELNKESFFVSKQYNKGRSIELIEQRNTCILYRYYYYSKVIKVRYADLIVLICKEFYLSERTVTNIITSNSKTLKQIFLESPTEKILQQKFNYLNWKI